jgi:hypothetical protein
MIIKSVGSRKMQLQEQLEHPISDVAITIGADVLSKVTVHVCTPFKLTTRNKVPLVLTFLQSQASIQRR